MLIDSRTLPEATRIEADIAIVGGGAAGIAMAREFIGGGLRVALLESGGLDYDDDTQDLYVGEVTGNPSIALDASRLRYLGGTSNHWAGYCRPLDEVDFAARPWVPHSGWPIGRASLEPYYRRAHPVLQLASDDYRPAEWVAQMPPVFTSPVMRDPLRPVIFQQSPPTRLGSTYRGELEQADDLAVYLWANLVEIVTDEGGARVRHLAMACLDGRRFTVEAGHVVLATGGVENARLLLCSNRQVPAGLGNGNDLVGRYFMDHPACPAATVLLGEPSTIARAPADQIIDVLCGIDPAREERERLLRFVTAIQPVPPPEGEEAGYVALRELTRNLRRGIWPDDLMGRLGTVLADLDGTTSGFYNRFFATPELLRLRVHIEVAPNPESRVTLIGERDALGLNRVRLDWRLTELDRLSLRRNLEIVGEAFGAAGLGRLRLADWVLEEGFAIPGNGSYHHVGTTRMSDDPGTGVVDRNCRVHGMHNLFVAGSSVFPTEGFANPTLTIVALGLRLADHLKSLHA